MLYQAAPRRSRVVHWRWSPDRERRPWPHRRPRDREGAEETTDCPALQPDKEHAETSMHALHLLQSSLVHINTLLLQQVLAEPAWAKKLSDKDRRGLTALFWSNTNPYGTFRLDMDKRLDLGLSITVSRTRFPEPTATMPS
ncbi:Tn3 family transposase [Streptomyces sp. NPDC005374]|uniref:Tn3 family transposase n=1 Tax=Streptomyces sp. NPDC005374 TaxID=3364713 RepID=UPI0036B1C154